MLRRRHFLALNSKNVTDASVWIYAKSCCSYFHGESATVSHRSIIYWECKKKALRCSDKRRNCWEKLTAASSGVETTALFCAWNMTKAHGNKHRTKNGHCGISCLSFCANAFFSPPDRTRNVFYAIQFQLEPILCNDEKFFDFNRERNETSLVT